MKKTYWFLALVVVVHVSIVSAQSNAVDVHELEDCNDRSINLDDFRESLPLDNSITIVILRAETFGYRITPIGSKITYEYDSDLVHIHSYELIPTTSVSFCIVNLILNGKHYDEGVIPARLWVTSSNIEILEIMKKEFDLATYRKDNNWLQLISVADNEDFFHQLESIVNYLRKLNLHGALGTHIS